jgi:glucokinase
MQCIVGVDVGGTNVVVGTVAADGSALYGLASEPTELDGPDRAIQQIVRMIHQSIATTQEELSRGEVEVLGVGLGSPGPLNTSTGMVLVTPNLGWTNLPLRDLISAATGLRATLDNDANCAVLGEWWRGAAQGARVVVGITIGTGIGGGIVLHGKIFHGASDIAGEIGHVSIDPTGRSCKCGSYGCVEAYASGPAIARRAVEGVGAGARTCLADSVGGDLSKITAQTVSDAARAGDAYCSEVIRETARFLGSVIASLINIFNPDVFVVCGGVTRAGDILFEPLNQEVKRRAFAPAVSVCRIVPGALPGTAGVFGAVASFKNQTEPAG